MTIPWVTARHLAVLRGFVKWPRLLRGTQTPVLSEEDKNTYEFCLCTSTCGLGRRVADCATPPPSVPSIYESCVSVPRTGRTNAKRAGAEVLLVGGGHAPFGREIDSRLLANPGSLGQSRSGEPVAFVRSLERRQTRIPLHFIIR